MDQLHRVTRAADWVVRSPRRLWVSAFTLFLLLAASWSIATPMGAAPDEPSHIIRAAGVARGQIDGPEVMVPHNVEGIPGQFAETAVELPVWYRQLIPLYTCYAWSPSQPASCAPKIIADDQRLAQTSTASGRYDPAYYLAVGWPSRVVSGPSELYLMRLASAAICAAILASAVVTAAEWRRRSLVLLGVFAAATPMAFFLAGVVNPSGGEIAAGLLVWTTLLTILMSPDPRLLTRRLVRLAAGGTILINIRPLGSIWFAGALVCALALQEPGALRMMMRRKVTWLLAAVLTGATAAMLLWNEAHPDHSVIHVPASLTPAVAARQTLHDTYLFIKQMVGFFGWLDTPAPKIVIELLLGVIGALTVAALVVGRMRERLVVLAMCVGIVLLPVVAQASQVSKLGMIWQGRYLQPFAMGLPLMAAMICARRLSERGLRWHGLAGVGFAVLGIGHLVAFYFAVRRYAVGNHGPLMITHAHWQPPGGWLLWVGLQAVGLGLLFLVGRARDLTRPEPTPVSPGPREPDGGSRMGRDLVTTVS